MITLFSAKIILDVKINKYKELLIIIYIFIVRYYNNHYYNQSI